MTSEITSEIIITLLQRCMPNADHIKWARILSSELRFAWRGIPFRISVETLLVEEIKGALLVSSDMAALIESLLKKQYILDGLK